MEDLLETLRNIYCNTSYADFLEKTGFIDCSYSQQKYNALKTGISNLCQFDAQTLTKLQQSYETTNQTY
ncbi:MAG: hypothetical protein ACLFQP_00555 [Halothece sp.]